MKLDKYNKIIDKINIPDDMDNRLKEYLLSDKKENKKITSKKLIKRFSIAVATMVLVLGVSQTSFVSTAASAIIHFFEYGFTFTENNGQETTINMKMNYLTLDKNTPMESMYMDSIDQVSDTIGIKLLNSTKEYTSNGFVEYYPSISNDNILAGIRIINNCYIIGDIKNISVTNRKSQDSKNMINYAVGENYKTPIGVQISIRTNENLTSKYQDNELGFVSENTNIDLDDNNTQSELYEIDNLGIKAVLFTTQTDGPIEWGLGDRNIDVTYAVFVYEGVEYVYFGGVSHNTMKEFLNTLK